MATADLTDLGDQKPIAEAELPIAPPPLTPEQLLEARLHNLNGRLLIVEHDNRALLGVITKLGELHGAKLKIRQVDKGAVFYWEASGRIVLP
jgi:hypothetical protein